MRAADEIQSRSSQTLQLSLLSDRWKHPADGMLGGHPGACSAIAFDDGRVPHQKSRTTIAPGQRITLHYAGGGGVGDPTMRDPHAVHDDVVDGYVSQDAARSIYGWSES